MRVQIGKYIIKNCDERNLVIVEQRPAGKNPKTGEMGTGVKEVAVGYYPNLEWALHKIKDLNISESDADTVDVLLAELEQIDETIRRVVDEIQHREFRPVVHAHWIDDYGNSACSECGCKCIEVDENYWRNDRKVMFCPYCGAIMDEDDE